MSRAGPRACVKRGPFFDQAVRILCAPVNSVFTQRMHACDWVVVECSGIDPLMDTFFERGGSHCAFVDIGDRSEKACSEHPAKMWPSMLHRLRSVPGGFVLN